MAPKRSISSIYENVEEPYLQPEVPPAPLNGPQIQSEEVASSSEPVSMIGVDLKCKSCRTRPANMLWFPCRHLCVCLACDQKVKVCPMCNSPKITCFMIILPYRS